MIGMRAVRLSAGLFTGARKYRRLKGVMCLAMYDGFIGTGSRLFYLHANNVIREFNMADETLQSSMY